MQQSLAIINFVIVIKKNVAHCRELFLLVP